MHNLRSTTWRRGAARAACFVPSQYRCRQENEVISAGIVKTVKHILLQLSKPGYNVHLNLRMPSTSDVPMIDYNQQLVYSSNCDY